MSKRSRKHTMEYSDKEVNILDSICDNKLIEVVLAKQEISESDLLEHAKNAPTPRGFINALRQKNDANQIGLIAEVKKASPSKGVIREAFDPVEIAKSYESAGAACLSVLTDTQFFQGENQYLQDISKNTSIPIIRKDFILDPYQVIEARAIGADCILLIMNILSDEQAKELESLALELGMDVLVEVHTIKELRSTLKHLKAPMIGINNRNLRTLEINRYTTSTLNKNIPDDRLVVCESGIRSHQDIKEVQKLGVNCFLVGENLMKENDIYQATKTLLGS